MIELGRLRALAAVARCGTVHGAADSLHCTPSAVSQHLSKLERETGSVLVERDGRRLRLTDAGALLAEHAAKVLAAVEEASAALAAHHGTVSGRVRFAAFPTACRGLLPTALLALSRDHPQLRPALLESDHVASLELLVRGEVDLAVVDDWPEVPLRLPAGLEHAELGVDEADLIVPATHRLAAVKSTPARLADLVEERWIASTPGSICHDWNSRVMPGVSPDFHVAEFATQLALVAAGLGIAILPRLARDVVPTGADVVPLDPPPRRRVSVVWRSTATARPAIGAAKAALRDAWAQRG